MPFASPEPASADILPSGTHQLSAKSILLILIYAALLLGVKLGSYRVLTLHEILFAQPAKEMLASGNWIHATIGGHPSEHKPLMTHWTIAAAMGLFQSDSPWVVRFPIALASVVSSLLVAALAARWFGDRIGLYAGLLQSSTLYFSLQARLAESDMLLCLAVTGAMVTFAMFVLDSPSGRCERRWLPAAFFAFGGMAFMTKGPVGLVFIFGGTLAWTVLTRDRRSLRLYFDPLGVITFLVLTLSWPIAAYVTRPEILEAWKLHHLQRFTNGLDGKKDTFYYYYHIPYLLLPWAPLLFVGLWRVLKVQAYRTKLTLFLGLWFLIGFVVLSMAAFKHKHYLIPILPPLSIVLAWGLDHIRNRLTPKWLLASLAGLTVVAGAVGTGLVLSRDPAWRDVVLVAITLGTAGTLLTLWLRQRQLWSYSLTSMFVTAGVLIVTIQGFLMPYFDDYRDQTDVALRASQMAKVGQPIYVVDLGETQALFYVREPAVRIDNNELSDLAVNDSNTELFALATLGSIPSLEQFGHVEILDRCASLRPYMKESDRIVFVRVDRDQTALSRQKSTEQVR